MFACPPGADFAKALLDGLLSRLADHPPEHLAKVELFVNTQRMRRRVLALLDEGPARLLPRIRVVQDLALETVDLDLPPPASALRQRLELARLISGLLDSQPELAPRSALFDLADSLAQLVAEMHDEAVPPEALLSLDVSDKSGHWQRSLKFLSIAMEFMQTQELPNSAARMRRVVEQQIEEWSANPPDHPIIVAGSTGSRGTTALLMRAVAGLPQGAVILPGFDFDLPGPVWDQLDNALSAEDHPQYRFRRLMKSLNMSHDDILPWHGELPQGTRQRNRLVSLALRPAPVTSQWLTEGPELRGIPAATRGMSLIEAPSPREEAAAISLVLRKAAEDGKTAALVTPDRTLTRRVQTALDRWRIEADVSAGEPLGQTAPGRLFRHVSTLFGQPLAADQLIVLLKHPLVNSASNSRGKHLDLTRQLELKLRRYGPAFPDQSSLLAWARNDDGSPEHLTWVEWINRNLAGLSEFRTRALSDHFRDHFRIVRNLVAGPDGDDDSPLWEGPAGQEIARAVSEISADAMHGGEIAATEYAALFRAILDRREVRDPVRPHPRIMIWGTLEARVQGADLVVLGGLNDGTWPELPGPDPWLNREMRDKAGLLVPERRIGLAAHDFQQAIAAPTVILSRALRDEDAETIPSRWINRLTNLLGGLSGESAEALKAMRKRGAQWLALAESLETPESSVPPEPRPAPRPPVAARPRQLSVTAIERLIRDPYAIYAREILRLYPVDSLKPQPDAPLRGTIIHKVMEEFIRNADVFADRALARRQLLDTATAVLERHAPWPAARLIWHARLAQIADSFLDDEMRRQTIAKPAAWEVKGALHLPEIDFTLIGRADRIDRINSGTFIVYDYKTGKPPTVREMQNFAKQLYLEALILEGGGFRDVPAGTVRSVGYIGLGAAGQSTVVDLESGEIARIRDELITLIRGFLDPDRGYMSRRAVARLRFAGDYDHLARYGEWDETQPPIPARVGE